MKSDGCSPRVSRPRLLRATGCGTSRSSSPNADVQQNTAGGVDRAATSTGSTVVTHGGARRLVLGRRQGGCGPGRQGQGVERHTTRANGDPGSRRQLIDNAVDRRPDGLVVSMANPDGAEKSIKAAVAAGVPVDRPSTPVIAQWKHYGAITHIGSDETVAGKAAGDQLKPTA